MLPSGVINDDDDDDKRTIKNMKNVADIW